MNKEIVIEEVGASRILPVVRTSRLDDAKRVVDLLVRSGCKIVEITLTIPGAIELIRETAQKYPRIMIGAGTVSNADQAQDCIAAGAGFIVSPWSAPAVIAVCNKSDIAVIPGALTPTEIQRAMEMGADLVKVFPVDSMGGVGYVRSLRSVMPAVRLIPTGGVTVQNASHFIRAGAFAVGIGSDLVSIEQLQQDETGEVISKISRLLLSARKGQDSPVL